MQPVILVLVKKLDNEKMESESEGPYDNLNTVGLAPVDYKLPLQSKGVYVIEKVLSKSTLFVVHRMHMFVV